MKVADGLEPGAMIGPLIDMKAVEKVEATSPVRLAQQLRIFWDKLTKPFIVLLRIIWH